MCKIWLKLPVLVDLQLFVATMCIGWWDELGTLLYTYYYCTRGACVSASGYSPRDLLQELMHLMKLLIHFQVWFGEIKTVLKHLIDLLLNFPREDSLHRAIYDWYHLTVNSGNFLCFNITSILIGAMGNFLCWILTQIMHEP